MEKRYIILLLLPFLFFACSKYPGTEKRPAVALSVAVADVGVTAKSAVAAPYSVTAPSSAAPLDARLLFSFNKGVYTNNPQEPYFIPCHTDVSFTSADLTFVEYTPASSQVAQNLTYPTPSDENYSNNNTVYCAGLYPKEGWEVSSDGKSASRTIDGEDDIMFAEQITGRWDNPFPVQQYAHLQTWLKILVSANTIDAAANWGKITKITVKSDSKVTVNFSNSDAASTVSYTTPTDITVFESSEGLPLNITTQELASVFTSPSVTCSVTVYTTEFTAGKTVSGIKLFDEGTGAELTDVKDIVGKLFILNLNFTELSVIEGVCTLNYWNDESNDLYLQ